MKQKIACSLILLHPDIELPKLSLVLFPSKTTNVSQHLDQRIIEDKNLNFRENMKSLIADVKSASFATERGKQYQSLMQQFV
jgi:hypothetical protein